MSIHARKDLSLASSLERAFKKADTDESELQVKFWELSHATPETYVVPTSSSQSTVQQVGACP